MWIVSLSIALALAGTPVLPQERALERPAQATKRPAAKPPAQAPKAEDAEAELERALAEAGTDRAALVRNLKSYLERFPETPRRVQVYRAMVEASLQLQDVPGALEYAERIVALRPDDASMMLLVVDLLERLGDAHSLTKAVGYVTRVLDRVEKSVYEPRPAGVAPEEWELEQKKLVMSVYLVRGRLEMERRRYDAAVGDLDTSYRTLPNAAAALRLGEIAEIRRHYERAIDHYLTAFALQEGYGGAVDRREVRHKLGNVWRIVHGSEAGLGEKLLQTYDRVGEFMAASAPAARNREAKELGGFEVRRLEGEPLKLADLKGKVVVLHFWATWCLPCREMEPLVVEVARQFRADQNVVIVAVNVDDVEAQVRPYVERERIATPIVFADGLERFFSVSILPTVIVIDREGKVAYRGEGFAPENLSRELTAAIERSLAAM